MKEEKRNKIEAAVTVNVLLLIVILAAVVIYQLVVIARVSSRKAQIISEIERYEALIKSGRDDLEYLQSYRNLRDLAIEYGYIFPDD